MSATRCFWVPADNEVYREYHDAEWGFPVDDDRRLFEKICLEGFQSGLSWWTILRKRDNFRAAFAGFDFERVARFGEKDVARLLHDEGIVRHRGKIEATINNAQRACEIVEGGQTLAGYVWQFEPHPSSRPRLVTEEAVHSMAKTPESAALSKDLKSRGWRFFGPTTAYAFMQAMGLVNDHTHDCVIRGAAEKARENFVPPR